MNIETFLFSTKQVEDKVKELLLSNIDFITELIGEIVKSIKLEGYMREDGLFHPAVDIEGKFGLISDMIIESKNINEYLFKNNEVYSHILDILNYDLYNVDNNMDGENNNNDNFNNKYFIYGYFIYLLGKILKYACLKDVLKNPTESLVNFINKKKNEITFSEKINLCRKNQN